MQALPFPVQPTPMSSPVPPAILRPQNALAGAEADAIGQAIRTAVGQGVPLILVDCREVTFMDSTGLVALVKGLQIAKAAGCHLVLCSLTRAISMVFELTQLDQVFEIVSSQEEVSQQFALAS